MNKFPLIFLTVLLFTLKYVYTSSLMAKIGSRHGILGSNAWFPVFRDLLKCRVIRSRLKTNNALWCFSLSVFIFLVDTFFILDLIYVHFEVNLGENFSAAAAVVNKYGLVMFTILFTFNIILIYIRIIFDYMFWLALTSDNVKALNNMILCGMTIGFAYPYLLEDYKRSHLALAARKYGYASSLRSTR